MIHKLEKKNYQKIRALLTPEQKNDLTLNAIINLTNRGTIYVDDVEQPRTALIDVTGVCSIFIGDVSNEQFISHLREFIENQLKINTYESCRGTYFLAVTDETWEKVLRDVISHRGFEIDYEIYYQFNESRFNSLKKSYKSLPDGYTIKKLILKSLVTTRMK